MQIKIELELEDSDAQPLLDSYEQALLNRAKIDQEDLDKLVEYFMGDLKALAQECFELGMEYAQSD